MGLVLPSGRTFSNLDWMLIDYMYKEGTVRWSDTPFALKNGGSSNVYFIGREDLTLNLQYLSLMCRVALSHLWNMSEAKDMPNCFIGVPIAGAAIAHWMAATAHLICNKEGVSFLAMRQVLKKHGNNQTWIDGRPPSWAVRILVENVRTTGGSEEDALEKMREDGIDTTTIIRLALVDRRLRLETPTMLSAFYMADIAMGFGERGYWSNQQVDTALSEFLQTA